MTPNDQTQQGPALRLASARANLATAEEQYRLGKISAAELLKAQEAFRKVREPMVSLIPSMAGSRFVELREG